MSGVFVPSLFRVRDGVREQQHSLRPWTGQDAPPDSTTAGAAVQDWAGWEQVAAIDKTGGWAVELLQSTSEPATGDVWDGWLIVRTPDGLSAGLQATLRRNGIDWNLPRPMSLPNVIVEVPAIAWSNSVLDVQPSKPDFAQRSWQRMTALAGAMHRPETWWGRLRPAADVDAERDLLAWASASTGAKQIPLWKKVGGAPSIAARWYDIGVSGVEAMQWEAAGVRAGLEVVGLREYGLGPRDAQPWTGVVASRWNSNGPVLWGALWPLLLAGWTPADRPGLSLTAWLWGLGEAEARQIRQLDGVTGQRKALLWVAGYGPQEMLEVDQTGVADDDLRSLAAIRLFGKL